MSFPSSSNQSTACIHIILSSFILIDADSIETYPPYENQARNTMVGEVGILQ
jgi:hypothetical protein